MLLSFMLRCCCCYIYTAAQQRAKKHIQARYSAMRARALGESARARNTCYIHILYIMLCLRARCCHGAISAIMKACQRQRWRASALQEHIYMLLLLPLRARRAYARCYSAAV